MKPFWPNDCRHEEYEFVGTTVWDDDPKLLVDVYVWKRDDKQAVCKC